MKKITLQLFCCLLFTGTTHCQPNIILIIGDDIGWNDFGFHGSNQIPTPNIDALAYNGVILNRFYSQATCTPSRAALLTGNYPIRLGFQGFPIIAGENRYLPLTMSTLPEQLKTLGYSTHLVGKWHLGYGCRNYSPTRRGFDQHFGYWNGLVDYFNYTIYNDETWEGFDLHDDFDTAWTESNQYATDVFTRKSLEVIQNHNKTNPLFLIVSHLAAHTGYDGTTLSVPDLNHTNEKFYYIEDERRRLYADIVNRLDDSVGQIVKALSDEDMLENSIIMYTSDNGGPTIGSMGNSASNWPLKGLKQTLFEGGVRVPAVIYSPLLSNKNYVNNELIHISDLYATFYGVAGGDVTNLEDVDSINQWSVISEDTASQREEILLDYDEVREAAAIIGYNGRFKLINGSINNGQGDPHLGESGRGDENPPYEVSEVLNSYVNEAISSLSSENVLTEDIIRELRSSLDVNCGQIDLDEITCVDGCLFDLIDDPCEYSNVISDYVDIASALNGRLKIFEEELVPQGLRETDPRSNPIYFGGVCTNWLDGIECSQPEK